MKQAHNLSEMHQSCDPRPLRRDELEFFVETAEARDLVISRRDQLRNRLARESHAKILLAGHGGCGKSTELVKLAEEVEEHIFTVSFSVAQHCNLAHVPIEDVLVVMMERLVAACSEEEGVRTALGEAEKALEEIYGWFTTELDIQEDAVTAAVEASAGVEGSRGLLGRVFGVLLTAKAGIRKGQERRHQVTAEKPHRLAALTARCNLLIGAVQQALGCIKRELLIVVEDLDKVNLNDARRIFIEQPAILSDLNANVLCTVPIFLLHSPDAGAFEQYFETIILPMPRVVNPDGSPCKEGRDAIRTIIRRRVRDGLIEPDALDLLLEKTGGVLRDIFEVLVVAAEAAQSLFDRKKQKKEVITKDNIRYGLNRRKSAYARAISTINLPPEWHLTPKDLYDTLRRLGDKPVGVLPSEPATMVLLESKAIVEYNGEGWFAVHPLVRELLDLLPE